MDVNGCWVDARTSMCGVSILTFEILFVWKDEYWVSLSILTMTFREKVK